MEPFLPGGALAVTHPRATQAKPSGLACRLIVEPVDDDVSQSERSRRSLPSKAVRFVVAALIVRPVSAEENAPREILICQRKADQPMSLKWEFPGGKIEPGETSEAALARELNEELGILAKIGPKITGLRHRYRNGSSVDLQFFLVTEFDGALENRIFNDVRWSPLKALAGYDFLAADVTLVRELAEGKHL